jgi:hypothetical protein
VTRLLCVIVLVACGGQPSAPAHPKQGPQASGVGPQQGVGPQAPDTKPTAGDDRCDKLIDRVVTLAVAERPVDQKPTEDERAAIVSQLRGSWTGKCEGMTAKGYDCAVRAQNLAELDRCGG